MGGGPPVLTAATGAPKILTSFPKQLTGQVLATSTGQILTDSTGQSYKIVASSPQQPAAGLTPLYPVDLTKDQSSSFTKSILHQVFPVSAAVSTSSSVVPGTGINTMGTPGVKSIQLTVPQTQVKTIHVPLTGAPVPSFPTVVPQVTTLTRAPGSNLATVVPQITTIQGPAPTEQQLQPLFKIGSTVGGASGQHVGGVGSQGIAEQNKTAPLGSVLQQPMRFTTVQDGKSQTMVIRLTAPQSQQASSKTQQAPIKILPPDPQKTQIKLIQVPPGGNQSSFPSKSEASSVKIIKVSPSKLGAEGTWPPTTSTSAGPPTTSITQVKDNVKLDLTKGTEAYNI